jgi:V/A-type H+-transporting ATPase subunit D
MSEATPTRSVLLEMKEERRAMHEGYVFLDEKCLLLAAEMLRMLERYGREHEALRDAHGTAVAALQAAVEHHGLDGVQVYPDDALPDAWIARKTRTFMGVTLQDAASTATPGALNVAVAASPQAEAARAAFRALLRCAVPLAATAGNLERLHREYRKSVRRARALQDVLLPELDRDVREIEARLEELEQEDAIYMRRGRA